MEKHYGHWMDIVQSLELESSILTKLTKPSIRINLVGPQVSLQPWWVPASRGSIHFLCVDHVAPSASKVVDDGEASDSNESEMGRRQSGVADGEVYEG